MPARLPTSADFPSHLNLTISSPPAASPQPTNVLILLHGLGDTSDPFTKLGKQLSLPETVCVSLQAPTPLPFDLGGFHWGDDIFFDHASGQMDVDTGFTKAVETIKVHIIEQTLIKGCAYTPREIIMFGLGQGGMAAIATASSMSEELGGVVSIGGWLPQSHSSKQGFSTPVLVLGGSSNTQITRTTIEKLRASFIKVEHHKWQRSRDDMPRSRDEMLPIMHFFARRLQSRQGVPDGSIQLG